MNSKMTTIRSSSKGIIFLSILLWLGMTTQGFSAKLPKTSPYAHFANSEELAEVLKNFAASQGISIVVSEKVDGVVNGKIASKNADEFLEKLSSVYNILWYYDGNTLYVYNGEEVETKIIKVRNISTGQLKKNLQRLQVFDGKFRWKELPNQRVIYVSGPARFVDLVSEMANLLDEHFGKKLQESLSIAVFPLRYALAYDRSYSHRGEKIVIPGVATILRQVLGRTTRSMIKAEDTQTNNQNEKGKTPTPSQTVNKDASNQFRITADRRLNAIIINDTKERIPLYTELINSLDVPSDQVEIEVSIIDVNTDHLEGLGIDWQVEGTDANGTFGSVSQKIAGGGAGFQNPANTIITAKANDFLGRVMALSEDGNAQILSRPSVLTMDKTEAILDNSSTFHVRVAGKEAVELFPVTVGTTMKVTPRIVNEAQGRMINLDIHIEDGHQEAETVDSIPVVKKSTIDTQAIISENSALLIGGYFYSSEANSESGVPLLEDLPILGLLFSWESTDIKQMVRMFLISPRIIDAKKDAIKAGPRLRQTYDQIKPQIKGLDQFEPVD